VTGVTIYACKPRSVVTLSANRCSESAHEIRARYQIAGARECGSGISHITDRGSDVPPPSVAQGIGVFTRSEGLAVLNRSRRRSRTTPQSLQSIGPC